MTMNERITNDGIKRRDRTIAVAVLVAAAMIFASVYFVCTDDEYAGDGVLSAGDEDVLVISVIIEREDISTENFTETINEAFDQAFDDAKEDYNGEDIIQLEVRLLLPGMMYGISLKIEFPEYSWDPKEEGTDIPIYCSVVAEGNFSVYASQGETVALTLEGRGAFVYDGTDSVFMGNVPTMILNGDLEMNGPGAVLIAVNSGAVKVNGDITSSGNDAVISALGGGKIDVSGDVTMSGENKEIVSENAVIEVGGGIDMTGDGSYIFAEEEGIIEVGGIEVDGDAADIWAFGGALIVNGDVNMTGHGSRIIAGPGGDVSISGDADITGNGSVISALGDGNFDIGGDVTMNGEYPALLSDGGIINVRGSVTIEGDETGDSGRNIVEVYGGGTLEITGDLSYTGDGDMTVGHGLGTTKYSSGTVEVGGSIETNGCCAIEVSEDGVLTAKGDVIMNGENARLMATVHSTEVLYPGGTINVWGDVIMTNDSVSGNTVTSLIGVGPDGTLNISGRINLRSTHALIRTYDAAMLVDGGLNAYNSYLELGVDGGILTFGGDVYFLGEDSYMGTFGGTIIVEGNVIADYDAKVIANNEGVIVIDGTLLRNDDSEYVWFVASGEGYLPLAKDSSSQRNTEGEYAGYFEYNDSVINDPVSYIFVKNPKLVFEYDATFDVPPSFVGEAIDPIDVSIGVSGGVKPYLFSLRGPGWLAIDPDTGVITGIPSEEAAATKATMFVFDDLENRKTIEIDVGAVAVPVKAVSVGGQNGTMTAGTTESVTFAVTTEHIADGTYPVSVKGLPGATTAFVTYAQVTVAGGQGTLTLTGTENTEEGTYNLTLTIDGTTSDEFTLTIAPAPVEVTFAAVQTGGVDGTADSTGIALTFSVPVVGLTADDVTIRDGTGAVSKGALSGDGMEWTIAITVATQGIVTVSVADFGDYNVITRPQSVDVYKDNVVPPTPLTFTAVQTGGAEGAADSTGIAITFDRQVAGLTAADVTLTNGTGAVTKGVLSGSGTTWTIAITVATQGIVTVSVADFGEYDVITGSQTVSVFKLTSVPDERESPEGGGDGTVNQTIVAIIAIAVIAVVAAVLFMFMRKP